MTLLSYIVEEVETGDFIVTITGEVRDEAETVTPVADDE